MDSPTYHRCKTCDNQSYSFPIFRLSLFQDPSADSNRTPARETVSLFIFDCPFSYRPCARSLYHPKTCSTKSRKLQFCSVNSEETGIACSTPAFKMKDAGSAQLQTWIGNFPRKPPKLVIAHLGSRSRSFF